MSFPLKKGNKEKDIMKEIAGDYLIKQTIGEGTFSKVKLGINMFTGQKVAIKILDKVKIIEEVGIERVLREIKISSELNHPNIIKIYKILEDDKYYLVVMEYCEEGELFNYIVKKDKLSEKESAFFYYQLINAIEYLHSKGIAHRDLKPENILLGENHLIKLIDFGLSNYFDENTLLTTPCGSPSYASPEMVRGEEYNGANNDIWATGIILFAMLCGYLPFENEDNDKNNELLFKKILEGNIEYPEYLSVLAIDLLKKILVNNPEKRIKINEIKQHKFYLKGKHIFEKKQESLAFNELKLLNNNQNENYTIDNNKKDIYKDKFFKILFTKNNHEENNKNINIFKKKYSEARQQMLTTFKNKITLNSSKNKPRIINNNNIQYLATETNNIQLNTDSLIPINAKAIKPLNDKQNLKHTFNASNKKIELNEDLEKINDNEIMKNIANLLPHRDINYNANNLFSQLQNKKEKSMDYPHKLYLNNNSLNTIHNRDSSIKSPKKKPLLQIKVVNSIKKKKNNLYENELLNNDIINDKRNKIKMNDKLIINLTNDEYNNSNKSIFRINRKLKKLDKKYNLNYNSPLKYQHIRLNTETTINDNFPYINTTRMTIASPKNENIKPYKLERKHIFKNINNIINLRNKEFFKYFQIPRNEYQFFNIFKTNENE